MWSRGCAQVVPVWFKYLHSFGGPSRNSPRCIKSSQQILKIDILTFKLKIKPLPSCYHSIKASSKLDSVKAVDFLLFIGVCRKIETFNKLVLEP